MIDKAETPLEFRRVQAADISAWDGDPDHSGARFLCDSIAACLGAQTAPSLPACRRVRSRSGFGALAVALAVAVAAVVGLFLYNSEPDDRHFTISYKIGENNKGCEPFEDSEEVISRGPIARIDLYHMGFIHGIRAWYGNSSGEAHGFTGDNEYRPTESRWNVPDGDAITRVEGAIRGRYVSRLRFFTGRGQVSPMFGVEGGVPFVVSAPAKGALRTISGTAVRVRGKDLNRAVCSMTFRFSAP